MRFFGIKLEKLIFPVDETVMELMRKVGELESGNKFLTNSKGSSARGKYQIMNTTFKRIVKYYNSLGFIEDDKVFLNHNEDNDDSVMLLLMDYYTRTLKSVFDLVDITPGIIYLCHFIGAERALKLLKHSDYTVKSVLSNNEVTWNKDVFKRFSLNMDTTTGYQFIDKIDSLV